MNILNRLTKDMSKKMGETMDDYTRYTLAWNIIVKNLPTWVSKLSKKRQEELSRAVYEITKIL